MALSAKTNFFSCAVMAGPWEAVPGEINGNWEKAREISVSLGKHAIYVQFELEYNVFPNNS
jgi:hypothetical protein